VKRTRPPLARTLVMAGSVLVAVACGSSNSVTGGSSGSSTTSKSITPGPGVDVANKTITIGVISALSGPAAALGAPAVNGAEAFWNDINASGGIDGWKINFGPPKDDDYPNTQMHVQAFNQIKDNIALLESFGSPTTLSIQKLVDPLKLVTAPLSWDSLWGADLVMAPLGTPYAFDIANALDYVTNAGAKKMKVGIIYQNDAYGQDGVRGYKAAVSAYGLTDVGQKGFAIPGTTDYTAQVQALKNAGAQVVVLTAIPSSSGPIIGTAATLNYHPQWILQGPSYIEQMVTTDGSATGKPTPIQPALVGSLVMMFTAPWGDTSAPGMAQVIADQQKYFPKQQPSIYFSWAYARAKVEYAILKKAIESGDLSREGIYNAKIHLGLVDLGGVAPNVTYSDQPGPPSRSSIIGQITLGVPGFLKPIQSNYEGQVAKTLTVGSS
jgi:ABC-type branched-subunit amino acid transport system substrate-binding protein